METRTLSNEIILILDFGSQYTQLIARRVREQNVFSEIHPYNVDLKQFENRNFKGIILSGGPSSVYEKDAPHVGKEIFKLGLPVLGICYGLQLITFLNGGQVVQADEKEYGPAKLKITNNSGLFTEVPADCNVWMSHGDKVSAIPEGFTTVANTATGQVDALVGGNLGRLGDIREGSEGRGCGRGCLYEITTG